MAGASAPRARLFITRKCGALSRGSRAGIEPGIKPPACQRPRGFDLQSQASSCREDPYRNPQENADVSKILRNEQDVTVGVMDGDGVDQLDAGSELHAPARAPLFSPQPTPQGFRP